MAADAAKGFFGGLLRASASRIASAYISSAVAAASPHAVLEITGRSQIDDVSRYRISARDGSVILHGPMDPTSFGSQTPSWIIIVHHPNSGKMWIIYRSRDQKEAQETFNMYKGIISLLIKCDSKICDKNSLEQICGKLREQSSVGWTAAHAAAAFPDYSKTLKNPLMKPFLNFQEGPSLRTPLHVAIEYKNIGAVTELIEAGVQLDIKDLEDNNIVHLAAQSSPEVLKLILEKLPERYAPFLNEANQKGIMPLLIACKSNTPENVKTLIRSGADVNISTKNHGNPIAFAVKNDYLVIIQELVTHSPGQLNTRDPHDGSSPIHWSNGPETLNMLLELGSDPNVTNNIGQTPLHIQVRKGSLKGALQLLCHHAFPDMKDEAGDTPLHIAARLCSTRLLQVLIAFDADVNLKNNRGESPRHLICTSQRSDKDNVLFYLDSVGAKRCDASIAQHCTEGCKFSLDFKGIPPENYARVLQPTMVHEALYAFSASRQVLARSRRGSFCEGEPGSSRTTGSTGVRNNLLEAHIGGRLLSLDGGGIRGVVLTQILIYMQREFGVPIVQLFDWIAGTSTGGIMALCLASGKSPVEIQALYLRLKDEVFTGERPYNSDKMESFLKQELGSETKMSDLLRPRLMITTAIAHCRPADFHFFRNYKSPSVILGEEDCCTRGPDDLFVWEVAKATGAAPSYFRLEGKYIDGGLVANNPTADALTELTQYAAVMRANGDTTEVEARLPSVVVSLGTGVQPRVETNATAYDISRPTGVFDAIVKVPKIASIIALLVEQVTQTEGHIVERSRAWCASIGVPYFRFSPGMSCFVDLDETNPEVLVNLMWETRAYLHAHHASVVELKHCLFEGGSPLPVSDYSPVC